MANKVKIYLPLYMLFIYYSGINGKSTVSDLARKTNHIAPNLFSTKKYLQNNGIIVDIKSKNKREHPFVLTKKGQDIFNAILIIIDKMEMKVKTKSGALR